MIVELFKTASIIFAILDPISACMIASFVMAHKRNLTITWAMRIVLSALAAGLVLHSAEQVQFIIEYKAPRAKSWVLIFFAVHAAIWMSWWRVRRIGHL
jgi:hypothetical protein